MLWILFCTVVTPFCLYYPFQEILLSLLCLGCTTLIPLTDRWSTEWVPDRDWKGTESVKIHYGLTHQHSLSPSPSFPESGKGGARRREGKKEEMTNWENYFAICETCVESFEEEGRWRFSWAHAERLWGLRSKLSPCWKITALHDRSASLSTLLFTFLPQPGSNFTLNCKLANAIHHLQLEAHTRSY